MEKEFVDYEIALELKRLGFDEPCFAFYYLYKDENYQEGKFDYRGELNIEYSIYKENTYYILAPTFSQAFRWFREKYGVHSSPRKYDETKWWVEWGTWTSSVFETFEEAELSWIKKLIEIVKEK